MLKACSHVQRWVKQGESPPKLCNRCLCGGLKQKYQPYYMDFGEADGAGTLLRIAASGDADGKFSPEALSSFHYMLDRWGDEVLQSLNTQSVVCALLLTVFVPLLLRELSYGPGAAPVAALSDHDGAFNGAWGDLPSFLSPDAPWRARRNLYVAECALLALAILNCFRGLNFCLLMSDMLHALSSPLDKGDYMLRSLHGFDKVHKSHFNAMTCFPIAMAIIAARFSAVMFFCCLVLIVMNVVDISQNFDEVSGLYGAPIRMMYEQARAILASKSPRLRADLEDVDLVAAGGDAVTKPAEATMTTWGVQVV